MIPFDNCFTYPVLERIDGLPEGRVYVSPAGNRLPSVTTILGKTKSEESKKALENWSKRVGAAKAEQIRNDAANIGQIIHKNLEKHILGEQLKFGSNRIYRIAETQTRKIINLGFPHIEKVYGQEVMLFCEGLFAGSTDLICSIKSNITIVDYKNSLKIKKEEYLDDYYTQLAAYATAHNEMFGTKIKNGRILMISRPDEQYNCDYAEFDLEGLKFEKFQTRWLKRLEQYYG